MLRENVLIFKRSTLWAGIVLAWGLGATLSAAVSALVRVDQVGYLPTETKYGMVASAAATGAFDVRRVADAVSVYSGTLGASFSDTDSGDTLRTADFSSLTVTGAYYLDVAGVGSSYNFSIDPNAFLNAYKLAFRGFYAQRCGTAVNMGTVDGVAYSHAICHSSGAASDLPATMHSSTGQSGTRNSAKGWHDAGDYGKYIVNAGISTGELLWTYECWQDRAGAITDAIPESGNGTPDLLNESRWELEWMLTMQDSDGGVWHKDTSAGFGSFTLPENDDAGTRYIIGTSASPWKTSCSTADFAAVMAIAARLYQPYDAAFAATCLTAAQNAWTWVSANPAVYYNQPSGISTGGYGDGNSSDERLWAAAELFRTTGTAAYSAYVVANAGASPLVSTTGLPQDWGNLKDLALWTYYFSGQAGANAALNTRINADTLAAATAIATRTAAATNGYKVSLSSGQYIWGSNGAVANYGLLLLMANKMAPNAAYTNAALDDLHYLLGRNTWDKSFVTHVGTNYVLHPHHRPSGSPQYSALLPWPGLMSGGPNSTGNASDGLTASSPYPAKCYSDVTLAYASNEIAINWQAPLVFLLAWTLPTPTPTPTATGTATGSATPSRTPSPSVTLSPSATRTASPSPTASPSVTPSASPTPTQSPTSTRSASPSATPTVSPTKTASQTRTPTISNTVAPTSSASPTVSATVSATVTVTMTVTLTATPPLPDSTPTGSPTGSATPSLSPSATLSATASGTPSVSASATPSATASGTPSISASETPSATPSGTSVSPTPSQTPLPTLSASPTPAVSPTASPDPTVAGAGSGLDEAVPLQAPQRGPVLALALKLRGPADRLTVRVYTKALVMVGEIDVAGAWSSGWAQASVALPGRLARGLYYLRVRVAQGGSRSGWKLAKLYVVE
jgi:endoglucanase